jgi:hypothetical protein
MSPLDKANATDLAWFRHQLHEFNAQSMRSDVEPALQRTSSQPVQQA